MDSISDKAGIIRITDKTPDSEAVAALLRAFFAFVFSRKPGEFTEITLRNRQENPIPDTEIILTHRTPDPKEKLHRKIWGENNFTSQNRNFVKRNNNENQPAETNKTTRIYG